MRSVTGFCTGNVPPVLEFSDFVPWYVVVVWLAVIPTPVDCNNGLVWSLVDVLNVILECMN